jgi:hypothetical protein
MIQLHLGDCLEFMKGLDTASVDAVITDPPYPREFLPLWEGLAEQAKRVLKPGGYCVSYSGQLFMPTVLANMTKYLDYRWCIALMHRQSQIVWPARTTVKWKPIFVFQNGRIDERGTPIRRDVIPASGMDKRFHEWGQVEREAGELIESFTHEGETVLDPFMGGGTTIIAADKLKRHAIGCEIDPEKFAIAERRISEAQLQAPLPYAVSVL